MDVAADAARATPRAPTTRAAEQAAVTDPTEQDFRLSHLVRRLPPAVGLVTVLHLLLLVTYSVAVPVYRAPDEPGHVDLVVALAEGRGWPAPGERFLSSNVSASLLHARMSLTGAPADVNLDPLQAGDAEMRARRPRFEDFGDAGPTPWLNQLTQHPPLYYVTGHVAVVWATALTPGVHWSYDRVVGLLRLLSVAMVGGVPLAAYAAARRLRASAPVAIGAAIVPLGIPMLTHIGSTVNNDNLLVGLVSVAFVLVTYVATGDRSRRTAGWLGVLGALALLTKGFALLVPVWVAAAYGVGLVRRNGPARSTVVAAATALATMAAGGWWWARNIVVHGSVQPHGDESLLHPDATPTTVPAAFLDEASRLPERFWGAFGWTQAILPDGVIAAATVVLGAGLAASLIVGRRTPRGLRWPRADVALLLLPSILVLAGVVAAAWSGFVETGVARGLQGRYLFVGVVGLAVGTVWGAERLAPAVRAWLPAALLGLALLMQVVGLHAVLDEFWSLHSGLAPSLEAMLLWSPWPRTAVLALAGVTAVTVVATAAAVLRCGVDRTATA